MILSATTTHTAILLTCSLWRPILARNSIVWAGFTQLKISFVVELGCPRAGTNYAFRCACRCGYWHYYTGDKVTNATKATILLEMDNYLISPTYFRRPAIPPPNCGPFWIHSSRTNRHRKHNNCVCRFSWKCRTCIQDCLPLWRRGRCINIHVCAIARFNSLPHWDANMYASWCMQ